MALNSPPQSPEFQPVDPQPPTGTVFHWERIHDLPMDLTVELGSTQIPLQAIAQLAPGHTIVLDQLVGEWVDCRLNGVLVARAEIGVQGDQYTIQIQEVLTQGTTAVPAPRGTAAPSEEGIA
jgi:flagellar motor switch protein FliN/FliY